MAAGTALPLASLYARRGAPIEVRVAAGETLYLPAWWHHSVTQSELTIAVNEWHDADFGSPAFALLSLARALAPAVERSWELEPGDSSDEARAKSGGGTVVTP
jgi:hypothetical protein